MMMPESVSTDKAKTEEREIKDQLGKEWISLGCFKIHPANPYHEFFTYKVAPLWLKGLIWLRNASWFGWLWWGCQISTVAIITLFLFADLPLFGAVLVILAPVGVLILDHFYDRIVSWHNDYGPNSRPAGLAKKYRCPTVFKKIGRRTCQIVKVTAEGMVTHVFLRSSH